MADFALSVNGQKHSGWTSLRISRSLEQLAHSFDVSFTDKWSVYEEPVPIQVGDAARILYGTQTVTTGWVDEDTIEYDATSRALGFNGRSLTGDLVDCAAVHKGGQWFKTGLLQIAKDLCAPFGITVSTDTDLGVKLARFVLNDGETVFQALERACRMRGVVMVTDGDGNLVFQRTGKKTVKTVLRYGENILTGSRGRNHTERFSTYTVKTQASAGGAEGNVFAQAKLTQKRASADSHVSRYRPTVLMAENEETGNELQKRADWERNVRAGRALRLSYRVQGWEHDSGLWEPNYLVKVVDPAANINDTLLIVTASQERSGAGTFTSLDLTFKEAFTVQPLPAPRQQKKKGLFTDG